MSTKSRPKDSAVITDLIDKPHAYTFVQAIRVIERAAVYKERTSGFSDGTTGSFSIGVFSPPLREIVRLKGSQSFDFPESEIRTLQPASEKPKKSRWEMSLNFIGLTGAMGVLPFHYTELILQRNKLKDHSLMDFLDIFNHRIQSLFFRASVKYRLPIQYERNRLSRTPQKPSDRQTQMLLSLIGMGTGGLSNRMAVKDESLLYYGGLFSSQVRTASGLKQILEHYFNITVKIQEFIGQWQELIPDIKTRLASRQTPKGQNAILGRTVMLGQKGWFAQGKIRVSLGPLNYEQFCRFAPGTTALKALNDMTRMYLGPDRDYDFTIQVKRKNFPRRMSLNPKQSPVMGWNTWLSSGRDTEPADDDRNLNIMVSPNRLK